MSIQAQPIVRGLFIEGVTDQTVELVKVEDKFSHQSQR